MSAWRMLRGQAEPIAVIILATAGLAIALLTWAWVNAKLAPLTTQATLTQMLAFERSREYADLLASGVNRTNGYYEYIVELMHLVVTARRWFAFTILVNSPNATGFIDPKLTEYLNGNFTTGVQVALLKPSNGMFVWTTQGIRVFQVDARNVILADGKSLYDHGVTGKVYVVMVPEYYSGIGDPTPEADVVIQISPTLLPDNSRPVLVTLTLFNNKWYEVTRLILG